MTAIKRYFFHSPGRIVWLVVLILLGPCLAVAGLLAGTRVGLTHFLPIYSVVSLIFVFEIVQFVKVDQKGIEYYSLTKRVSMTWDDVNVVELQQVGYRQALCFAVKPMQKPRPETISSEFIMLFNLDPTLLAWINQRWGAIDGLDLKEKSA